MTKTARSLPAWLRPYLPEDAADARRLGVFIGVTMFLDTMFNLRFPAGELHFWYLLPSIDVMMIFGAFAIVRAQGWRVPKIVLGALAALVLLVRVLRFGDSVQDKYYAQKFTLYDLALAPEGVRFLHSTLDWYEFWPLVVGGLVVLVLLPIASYFALRTADAYLADMRRLPLVAFLAIVAFGIGFVQPRKVHHQRLLMGGFGISAGPRIRREAEFLLRVQADRGRWLRAIEQAKKELERTPSDLSKLRGRNVHFILVESYGVCAIDRPEFARTVGPTFDSIQSSLGTRGFTLASGRLVSTTYGGRSWLAHATLATSIPTSDQFGYDVVFAEKPKTLAMFFRAAGYRTVLAAPGTTRAGTRGDLYRFEKNYHYAAFEYAGPAFAWATMPDQYVLDVIRRRELVKPTAPLFIQYVLVSSHAPWSETPTIVEDWSRLGNGAIFDTQPVLRFPVVWPKFHNAQEAYIRSIVYDFEVIKRYIEQFITDDSLVIVMGDHQPVAEVTGNEDDHGVPIHVFSRSKELVEPFLGRGYVPGFWPRGTAKPRSLESFLPDLLRDFSTPPKR